MTTDTPVVDTPIENAAPAAVVTETPVAPAAAPANLAADPAPASAPAGEVKPTWPDNWRDILAGGDEAFRKQLERMTDPTQVAKNYRELEKKKGTGELKKSLPEGATPEEITNWRKENGIPTEHTAYLEGLQLPSGMAIGEADMPIVDGFLKRMHEQNTPPAIAQQALSYYYEAVQQQADEVAQRDAQLHQAAQDELRADWGSEYRMNVNSVKSLLASKFGEDVASSLYTARLADGTVLGNNPAVLKGLAQIAREIDPAATVVPGVTNAPAAIESEIAQIESKMGTAAYYADPGMQKRYLDLVTARDKVKARG